MNVGLHISRTVLLPESAGLILSAACCLPLKTVELINTGMQKQSIPHLAMALQRPTAVRDSHPLYITIESSATGSVAAVSSNRPVRRPLLPTFDAESNIQASGSKLVSESSYENLSSNIPNASSLMSSRPLGPNLWLTLADLDLSGNNLGDDGLH